MYDQIESKIKPTEEQFYVPSSQPGEVLLGHPFTNNAPSSPVDPEFQVHIRKIVSLGGNIADVKRENMPPGTLRVACESDIDWIVHLEDLEEMIASWGRERHLNTLHDPNYLYLVVSDESNTPIAYSIFSFEQDEQYGYGADWIRTGVKSDRRSKGWGRVYTDCIFDFMFRKIGLNWMRADVFADNTKGIRFHARNAWRIGNEIFDGKRLLYQMNMFAITYFKKLCRKSDVS